MLKRLRIRFTIFNHRRRRRIPKRITDQQFVEACKKNNVKKVQKYIDQFYVFDPRHGVRSGKDGEEIVNPIDVAREYGSIGVLTILQPYTK